MVYNKFACAAFFHTRAWALIAGRLYMYVGAIFRPACNVGVDFFRGMPMAGRGKVSPGLLFHKAQFPPLSCVRSSFLRVRGRNAGSFPNSGW